MHAGLSIIEASLRLRPGTVQGQLRCKYSDTHNRRHHRRHLCTRQLVVLVVQCVLKASSRAMWRNSRSKIEAYQNGPDGVTEDLVPLVRPFFATEVVLRYKTRSRSELLVQYSTQCTGQDMLSSTRLAAECRMNPWSVQGLGVPHDRSAVVMVQQCGAYGGRR